MQMGITIARLRRIIFHIISYLAVNVLVLCWSVEMMRWNIYISLRNVRVFHGLSPALHVHDAPRQWSDGALKGFTGLFIFIRYRSG
jgi:hypothetical protein